MRFAGPRLAAAEDDDLVPVKLRRGGRILGGSMSWDKPQPLAAFSREGPFNGMPVPNDVTVTRQVLAEPDAALSENTWATLADGTPLVTAARRGKGLIVLFHVTGDTRWSDLPLSGSFVDMLKRIVALAGTTAAAGSDQTQSKTAREMLREARARRLRQLHHAAPDGTASAGGLRRQRDAGASAGLLWTAGRPPCRQYADRSDRLAPLDFRPSSPPPVRLSHQRAAGSAGSDLPRSACAPAARYARRSLSRRRLAAPHSPQQHTRRDSGHARCRDPRAYIHACQRPANKTQSQRAAVGAGNQARLRRHRRCRTDAISKAGLAGLTLFLAQRTALEPGDPIGLDIGHDELAFYPLIYWPVVPGAPRPSEAALKRIDTYMKDGGTVLFDTRDAVVAPPGPGGETQSPGHAGVAQDPLFARYSRTRTGVARSRA